MMGSGLGVRRMTQFDGEQNVSIRRRTLTSQVSQFRSSEMEYMRFRRWPFAVVAILLRATSRELRVSRS